jgi:DNA segregation ATPase FtsK/SpoIIIE, S-DNA-T family
LASRKTQPTRKRTAATRKTKPGSTRATTRKPRRSKPQQNQRNSILLKIPKISAERRMDLIGILLALVGFLSLLSLISSDQGFLTGWWVNILRTVFGWGSFIIPITLMIVGAWLIFRNFENMPEVSAERILGVFLLFLNMLAVFHLLIDGDFSDAVLGLGGGYLGAFFKLVLVRATGLIGAIVGLLAWFLIGIILTFDIAITDLVKSLRDYSSQKAISLPRSSSGKSMPAYFDQQSPQENGTLPEDFHPIRPTTPFTRKKKEKPESKDSIKPSTAAIPSLDRSGQYSSSESRTTTNQVWRLPVMEDILDPSTPVIRQANLDMDKARVIEETLASFGVPAHVVEIHRGPTITQFGIEPDFVETRSGRTRVRVSKITSLVDDLALALAARRIRIQAPVPGKSYVGIEVPNEEVSQVSLREVLESKSFLSKKSPLRFALGKDVSGKPVAADLADMPHLLIAGTTGSGKSVCINTLLAGFLIFNDPTNLRLILVDPKRVELTGYNGIPHLLAPVVVDMERVVAVLQWALREMDQRYDKFSKAGVRNILEFNSKFTQEKLPYLVVIIDELADLMMIAPDETERSITRLAQLARATGIHLIIATQRPSVDVVTGLIKANFPARIAFAVASGVDSRVILDQPGAERLLGRGDMLFQSPEASAPVRLQGAFVSDTETQKLVEYWKLAKSNVSSYPQDPGSPPIDQPPGNVPFIQEPLFENGSKDEDPLLDQAVEIVRQERKASITLLQRKMRVGYTRAARLIDALESRGIISPQQVNSQVREVLDYGKDQNDAPEDVKENL